MTFSFSNQENICLYNFIYTYATTSQSPSLSQNNTQEANSELHRFCDANIAIVIQSSSGFLRPTMSSTISSQTGCLEEDHLPISSWTRSCWEETKHKDCNMEEESMKMRLGEEGF